MTNGSPSFRDQHLIETYKSLVPIATGALRAVMLLNGGAAVALLAYLGSPARTAPGALHVDMRWPMGLFLLGIAFAGIAHIGAYLTQLALYNETLHDQPSPWLRHHPWLWATITSVVVSLGLFIWGAMSAVARFAV